MKNEAEHKMNSIIVRLIIICSMFAIVISCNHGKNSADTSGIIPEDKLVPLLMDIHLADAMSTEVNRQKMNNGINTAQLYQSVFAKYGYTREQFDKSIAYYSGHMDVYQAIYDKVIVGLSKKESMYSQGLNRDEAQEFNTGKRDTSIHVKIEHRVGDSIVQNNKPDSAVFKSLQQAKEQVRKMIQFNKEKNRKK